MTIWYDRVSSYDPEKVLVIDDFSLYAVSLTEAGLAVEGRLIKWHYEDKEQHGHQAEVGPDVGEVHSPEQ